MNNLSNFFEEIKSLVKQNNSNPVRLVLGEKEIYADYKNLKDYCGSKAYEQQISVKFGNKGIDTILFPEKEWKKTIKATGRNFTEKDFDSLRKNVEKYLQNL